MMTTISASTGYTPEREQAEALADLFIDVAVRMGILPPLPEAPEPVSISELLESER